MTRTRGIQGPLLFAVRGALFLLLLPPGAVCVGGGGFMGMGLLGYGKLDLCVSATKITIERVWEFGVLIFSIPRFWINKTTP